MYCGRVTTGSEGRAHAVPEVLLQNDLLLPPGAECDPCNNYLRKLDDALVLHPMIGLAVQKLGLPGKRGKPRQRLSGIEREPTDDPEALIRGDGVVYSEEVTEDGKTRIVASFQVDPGFDMLKFRRALHRLAFNALARRDGLGAALDAKWDRLRDYLRRPTPKQSRPFAQLTPDPGWMPPNITVTPVERGAREVWLIHIFGAIFVVELTESETFEQLAREKSGSGWVYVGPMERDPIGLRFEVGDP
jgi:hypothetical protein